MGWDHTLQRYRTQHPGATSAQMKAAIIQGEDVSQELVWALTHRTCDPNPGETYVTPPDKMGIFVIPAHGRVVTYLRLSIEAQRILQAKDDPEPTTYQAPAPPPVPKPRMTRPKSPMEQVQDKLKVAFQFTRVPRLRFSARLPKDDFRQAIPRLLETDPNPMLDGCVYWGRFLFLRSGSSNKIFVHFA